MFNVVHTHLNVKHFERLFKRARKCHINAYPFAFHFALLAVHADVVEHTVGVTLKRYFNQALFMQDTYLSSPSSEVWHFQTM